MLDLVYIFNHSVWNKLSFSNWVTSIVLRLSAEEKNTKSAEAELLTSGFKIQSRA